MEWNHTNNQGNDRDPWGNQSHKETIKSRKEKSLNIESIHRIREKLRYFFSKKNKNTTNKSLQQNRHLSYIITAVIVAWIGSGFYTIKEAEKGVVLRFGKFNRLVQPGLNWKPTFIDTVTAVNIESVREIAACGIMLTSDENVVKVEMNVQYRITNPRFYLFSVINADNSLHQATDSALRGIIGKYTMDKILTEGRTIVRSDTQRVLEEIIQPYNIGIDLLDVNFQLARPPEEVKAAFDDAIAARENEQQYIREAEAYANEVRPRANGKAQRILEEGRAYKVRTILEAKGEIERLSKLLPEYNLAPSITKERLYIQTMEKILNCTKKVIVDDTNNLLIMSLDKLLQNKNDDSNINNNQIFLHDSSPPKNYKKESNSKNNTIRNIARDQFIERSN
ncbi:FtsH protease activity modulator HflK [Candidatus Schneideria nysicola]|uniref:FtsH protease activity modulator HflK n=1 Tax=Candidatus Schneideria nysicola TaxID=1081631 RepID=UPI001CAA457D|nr:FtsH protease activity modulator HflK [Candidatus Schneideria nysicola]UAJ65041.1 FtsH protease activity modulator HflK [Candidatus Schneideria nysicola]